MLTTPALDARLVKQFKIPTEVKDLNIARGSILILTISLAAMMLASQSWVAIAGKTHIFYTLPRLLVVELVTYC